MIYSSILNIFVLYIFLCLFNTDISLLCSYIEIINFYTKIMTPTFFDRLQNLYYTFLYRSNLYTILFLMIMYDLFFEI